MKQIYNERLLKFADHLDSIRNHPEHGLVQQVELIALEQKVRIHYKVLYQYWIFSELPVVFEDWYYHSETGDALLEGEEPEIGTVGCVCAWFGLNQDEFAHLFDIEGCQLCERFGGQKLNEHSDGPDFAQNIVEFVKK